ncbi:MAG: hypothetical protein ACKVYV_12905 [Limisphaerales bacterium]
MKISCRNRPGRPPRQAPGLLSALLLTAVLTTPAIGLELVAERQMPLDLELSGRLPGGRTNAFLTRAALEALPRVTVTNAHDLALNRPAAYSGVPLADLVNALGLPADAEVVWAVCKDGYVSHFTREDLAHQRPLLVLELDGARPDAWPKAGSGVAMAPYYVSPPAFAPRDAVVGVPESPKLPYAVNRLHFTDAAGLLRIQPANASSLVLAGAVLAKRECLSCHNHFETGGVLSARPWALLATWAKIDPGYFRRYVRSPQSVQPAARMPGYPGLSDEALEALVAYFKAFQP